MSISKYNRGGLNLYFHLKLCRSLWGSGWNLWMRGCWMTLTGCRYRR